MWPVDNGRTASPLRPRPRPGALRQEPSTPLALQGRSRAEPDDVIPVTLVDHSRKPTDVQAEFGVDINGDGSITDDEYRPASEDRLDPRDTRRNRKPQLFSTSGDIGATHAYAWRTTTDVGTLRFETQLYKYTPQGRLIPDTAHPGEFLFDDAQAGVRVRVRTVRGAGKARRVGAWSYTDAFSVNNNTQPALTIDQVLPNASGTASDEHVEVLWTAIDADSEDKDGDGVFDVGEDANGNRTFDQEQVGVAFDYYRLQPGDDPSAMSDDAMAALTWAPCTRVASEGNTDSFLEADPSKAIYGSPKGRQWRFVWNSVADVAR